MARVDRDVVRERLERLSFEVDAIAGLLPPDVGSYAASENETVRYALEHHLFLALQATLDVAAHVAVSLGVRPLRTYGEALAALVRLGVVPPEVGAAAAGAAGMRNALAHEYTDLDDARVYEAMKRAEDLRRYAAAVWEWVQGQ